MNTFVNKIKPLKTMHTKLSTVSAPVPAPVPAPVSAPVLAPVPVPVSDLLYTVSDFPLPVPDIP